MQPHWNQIGPPTEYILSRHTSQVILVPAEITCCTPANLRENDDARDGVCMYVGQSQEVIFDGWSSRGVLIESRFVFDACFTRIAKTGPNIALTA